MEEKIINEIKLRIQQGVQSMFFITDNKEIEVELYAKWNFTTYYGQVNTCKGWCSIKSLTIDGVDVDFENIENEINNYLNE